MKTKTRTGAEIFFECLKEQGVELMFGYPGGAALPLYDELYKQTFVRHVLVRHEQGATHAAEGYAKATGKPGVVLVTSGPGATNTVTGITDAMMDSIPLVVFSGQVPTKMIGRDAFQEADVIGITRPVTKWNAIVRDVNDLAETIRKAFDIATSGRPGPVLVDLPKDVCLAQAEFTEKEKIGTELPLADAKQLEYLAYKIKQAKRPLFYVGGGTVFSEASEELKSLSKRLNIPVISTLHGLGAYPGTDEQFLGMVGMHGTYVANRAIDECDCLVAIGARFDDRVTGNLNKFSTQSFKIQIDIDPSNFNKDVPIDVAVCSDIKQALTELKPLLNKPLELTAWWAQLHVWKASCPLEQPCSENGLYPQTVLTELNKKLKGEAVVVTDVGQNQMWAAQYLQFNWPRTHISSGGLGTMGFSVPASIGAAFGQRDKRVVSISGDGGFQMNMQELILASVHHLPITFIILNNNNLGMVRQWQDLFHDQRFSETDLTDKNPDFVTLAEAMSIPAKRVVDALEINEALHWSLEKKGPSLIEFVTVKEEMVFPMIPSGGAVSEIKLQRF